MPETSSRESNKRSTHVEVSISDCGAMPALTTANEDIDSFWPEDMPLPTLSDNDGSLTIDEGSLTEEAPHPDGGGARADDSSDSDGPPASDAAYIPHTPRSDGRERSGGGPTVTRVVPPKTKLPSPEASTLTRCRVLLVLEIAVTKIA